MVVEKAALDGDSFEITVEVGDLSQPATRWIERELVVSLEASRGSGLGGGR